MKEETRTIINYRLERAKESLKDANKLFKDESLHSTVNRIYYAMFYSVNALLLSRNLSSSKHSGVKALFHREFVSKGEVDRRYGRFFSEILERRQAGDYRDLVTFKKEDVEVWLKKAEEFINKIEEITLKIVEKKKRN